ncbi:MAG: hypothetical protein M1319_01510 [Chloroflexi bacterium]|nr:hypothetical protein [Chloroflexota bacterium]
MEAPKNGARPWWRRKAVIRPVLLLLIWLDFPILYIMGVLENAAGSTFALALVAIVSIVALFL